jgi:proline iminopeptidase
MPIAASHALPEKGLPFDHGYFSVGAGHQLYFAQYGQPDAPAAIVLHGGPGSGCRPSMLDWFDLSRQRVILLDQRGAGKSTPSGSITDNRTADLVEDIERLRIKLGIENWLVVGGSWGATLALTYAGKYLGALRGMVLRGTFLASPRELDWFFQSVGALVPQAWARMTTGWRAQERQAVLQTLNGLLQSGTPDQRADAALRWAEYEDAVMQAMLGGTESSPPPLAENAITKYTLQAHYLSQACFTSERALFRCARRASHIPTTVIHGTHDLICPPENAVRLLRFMPQAKLRWIENGTHTPADPAIAEALRLAIHDFI